MRRVFWNARLRYLIRYSCQASPGFTIQTAEMTGTASPTRVIGGSPYEDRWSAHYEVEPNRGLILRFSKPLRVDAQMFIS